LPELVFTHGAKADLKLLLKSLRGPGSEALDRVSSEPRIAGQPLLGRLRGRWSARVGNYRIIYTIEGRQDRERVIIRAIRHRAVAYGRPR